MGDLLSLLEKVKLTHKIIMIYIHEAHADDIWPMGFGINSAKNLEEKWTNCDALMKKWPQLKERPNLTPSNRLLQPRLRSRRPRKLKKKKV